MATILTFGTARDYSDTTDMGDRIAEHVRQARIARRNARETIGTLAECEYCGVTLDTGKPADMAHVSACYAEHRPYQYGRRA